MTRAHNFLQPMSQDERIQALKQLDVHTIPFLQLLGAESLNVLPNNILEISITPHDNHHNIVGSIHGGIACTLLDTVNSLCANAALDKPHYTASMDMHIHYLRPIFKHTGRLRAHGKILKLGKRVIVVESGLYNSQDQLMAHSIGKEMILSE